MTAAHEWDDPAQFMTMNPPIQGSIEQMLSDASDGDSLVVTHIIEELHDGSTRKYEVLPEPTEYVLKRSRHHPGYVKIFEPH